MGLVQNLAQLHTDGSGDGIDDFQYFLGVGDSTPALVQLVVYDPNRAASERSDAPYLNSGNCVPCATEGTHPGSVLYPSSKPGVTAPHRSVSRLASLPTSRAAALLLNSQ